MAELIMACSCRDGDGNLAQRCNGQCAAVWSERINNPDEQMRAQEDGFTNKQLQQISDIVRQGLSVSVTLDKVWIDGFLKGLEHGQQSR
jgi:hypothetical protein